MVDWLSITDVSAHQHTVQLIDQGLTYRNEFSQPQAGPQPSRFIQQVIIDNLEKNLAVLDDVEKVRDSLTLELMQREASLLTLCMCSLFSAC